MRLKEKSQIPELKEQERNGRRLHWFESGGLLQFGILKSETWKLSVTELTNSVTSNCMSSYVSYTDLLPSFHFKSKY